MYIYLYIFVHVLHVFMYVLIVKILCYVEEIKNMYLYLSILSEPSECALTLFILMDYTVFHTGKY